MSSMGIFNARKLGLSIVIGFLSFSLHTGRISSPVCLVRKRGRISHEMHWAKSQIRFRRLPLAIRSYGGLSLA